jgi:hypothetical protein
VDSWNEEETGRGRKTYHHVSPATPTRTSFQLLGLVLGGRFVDAAAATIPPPPYHPFLSDTYDRLVGFDRDI